jgi:hypothetical protein
MSLMQLFYYGSMNEAYPPITSFYVPDKIHTNFIQNNILTNETFKSLCIFIKNKSNEINILKYIKELQWDKDDENSCAVCYCNFCKDEDIFLLPCKHSYHKKCVRNWLLKKQTCPYCRECIKKTVY